MSAARFCLTQQQRGRTNSTTQAALHPPAPPLTSRLTPTHPVSDLHDLRHPHHHHLQLPQRSNTLSLPSFLHVPLRPPRPQAPPSSFISFLVKKKQKTKQPRRQRRLVSPSSLTSARQRMFGNFCKNCSLFNLFFLFCASSFFFFLLILLVKLFVIHPGSTEYEELFFAIVFLRK